MMNKYYFHLIATMLMSVVVVYSSCSKEDNIEVLDKETITIYDNAFENAFKFVSESNYTDVNAIIDYINTIDGVTSVQVEDSIIRVTVKGEVQFSIDCNYYPDHEVEGLDLTSLNQYIDSIDDATGSIQNGYEETSKVFKDYITEISKDENVNTATRAATSSFVLLKRRNFLIWSPYKSKGLELEKNAIINMARNVVEKDKCFKMKTFTPKSFSTLGSYDMVYFSCHGGKDGSFFLPEECLLKEEAQEYESLIENKGGVEKAVLTISGEEKKGYRLHEDFLKNYLGDLSNTVIYTSACYMGANNCVFKKCCEDKHVADYFGSDTIVDATSVANLFIGFYPKLMNGLSTEKAFNNGKNTYVGSYLNGKTLESFTYKRYGKKTVGYIKPQATGIGYRTNTNKRMTRSGEEAASPIVVNARLKYASDYPDNILSSIEAGICLQDMETKKVTLIPFSSKNMLSNEEQAYGNVTVSNISVSLEDLETDHQYAYCCYTSINGQITLSEECYKFTDEQNYSIIFDVHCTGESYYYFWSGYDKPEPMERNTSINTNRKIYLTKIDGKFYLNTDVPRIECMSYNLNPSSWGDEADTLEIGQQRNPNFRAGRQSDTKSKIDGDCIYVSISQDITDVDESNGISSHTSYVFDIKLLDLSSNPHAEYELTADYEYLWKHLDSYGRNWVTYTERNNTNQKGKSVSYSKVCSTNSR